MTSGGNLKAVPLDKIACTFIQISRLHLGITKKELATTAVVISLDTGTALPDDIRVPSNQDPRAAVSQYREAATVEKILKQYMVLEHDGQGSDDKRLKGKNITMNTLFEIDIVLRQIERRFLFTPCLEPRWSVNSEECLGPVTYPLHFITQTKLENHHLLKPAQGHTGYVNGQPPPRRTPVKVIGVTTFHSAREQLEGMLTKSNTEDVRSAPPRINGGQSTEGHAPPSTAKGSGAEDGQAHQGQSGSSTRMTTGDELALLAARL